MTQASDRSDAPAQEWQPQAPSDDSASSSEPTATEPARKKRRRSRRRPAGASTDADAEAKPERGSAAPPTSEEAGGDGDDRAPARRKRGGRSRRRGAGSSDSSDEGPVDPGFPGDADDEPRSDAGDAGASGGGGRSRRRGRGRRGRRSLAAQTDGRDEAEGDERSERVDESNAPRDGGDGVETESRPRRRRGGRRRRRSGDGPRDEDAASRNGEAVAEDRDADAPSGAGDETPRKKRRRGRRGRGTSDGDSASSDGGEEPRTRAATAAQDAEGSSGRRRRRGKRGGRKRNQSANEEAVAIDGIPGDEDEDLELAAPAPQEAKPKGRGRKGQGDSDASEAKTTGRKKRGRKAETKSARKAGDDAEPEAAKSNVILVNASDPDETRVAVVEEGRLVDFQMTVKNQVTLVNDIYRGKVVNLEPAIGAAFIDFGQGRNGFLHTSDVLSCYGDDDWDLKQLLSTAVDVDDFEGSSQPDVDEEMADDEDAPADSKKKGKKAGKKAGRGRHRARPRLPITELLQKGASVVVQVTKDAIGDKGPTLTTYISIPGRHLVLMPSVARTGVSRKIDDEKERRRLKRILKGLDVPDGMGVIVRTAGIGATKAELKRDLEYLLLAWESFGQRLTLGRGPIALYEESDVALRVIRDLFTDETEKIVVDDEKVHARMVEFTKRLVPDAVDRIELHDGPRPLFHTFGVEQDFEKIFARRVDLASGGSIVFDQAEALVAIDVNSGKTRSDGFDFEEVALKTNLEAVPEIARQIRLRDLGGIVVVDFIDMMRMANRRAVERAFRQALAGDRARSKLGRISQFGLLEMTRQRLGAGMSKMLFTNCQRCRGTGRQRTVESRTVALLRRLGSALTLKGFTKVEVRAHPDTIEYLTRNYGGHLSALERNSDRKLVFTSVPDQLEDSVLRYLRADGREVRPGGRRKR